MRANSKTYRRTGHEERAQVLFGGNQVGQVAVELGGVVTYPLEELTHDAAVLTFAVRRLAAVEGLAPVTLAAAGKCLVVENHVLARVNQRHVLDRGQALV